MSAVMARNDTSEIAAPGITEGWVKTAVKPRMAAIMVWPASMFAKRRMARAQGLTTCATSSTGTMMK